MGESAAERKQRLLALRKAAELASQPERDASDQTSTPPETAVPEPEQERPLKFRNYLPKDDDLVKAKVAAAVPGDFEEIVKEPVPGLDDVKENEDAITSLAPKKANWDLKRDVTQKLEKLERRTQKAMIQLMQEAQEVVDDEEGV
mmetsp:Transcript_28264/g.53454  ORF Transcript_28264/g.53454 Transcript_28264/m.53454 type:complete len:145 (+) Transcript_28264:58-492(+)